MDKSISRVTIRKSALLIVLFISILTVTSLFYMREMNKKTELINKQYKYKVELLFEMSQIIRDRTFDVFVMYLSDDVWQKDEVFLRFNKRALKFIQLRQELTSIDMSKDMKEGLDKAYAIIRLTQPLQENIVDDLRNPVQENTRKTLLENDLPLEAELYKVFDQLLLSARSELKKEQQSLENRYQNATIITIFFSILIVSFTIYIMNRSMQRLHANEMSISWDAVHDHLTKVYNRRWLSNYMEAHIVALNNCERHAILYIDIDNFKPVNDMYGHNVGDKVLVDVVDIFNNCIRKSDMVVRIGGDEFCILLENCSRDKAYEIASGILKNLADYILELETDEITGVSCSIGIAFIDQQTSWQLALEYADEECNKVKRGGKSGISIH